jgi:uncharacterized YigZ family protein
MLFSDQYFQIKNSCQAQLRERGSKFLAYAYPVFDDEEVRSKLQQIRSEFPDATHHCYAYVLNPDKSNQRASDDGEPAGTAGKPILRAILSQDLTNTMVIVIRYFGGTMLGVPGLIQAYGDAAKQVLALAEKEEKYIEDKFQIAAAFEHEQEIHRIISQYKLRVLDSAYTDKVTYRLAVRRNLAEGCLKAVREHYQLELILE